VRSYCELQVWGAIGPFGLLGSGTIGNDASMEAMRGMFGAVPVRRVDAATAFAESWREVRRAQIFAARVDGSMLDLGNQRIGVA
jgi:hypothetical protein